MKRDKQHASFGGVQEMWTHHSGALDCEMRFGIFLPRQAATRRCPVLYFLSGLTCTADNFVNKAGAQRYAAEHGIILVAPDTSPRGDEVPDVDAYDLGKGAGFYLNATQSPWARNFQMHDYVAHELPALIESHFPASDARGLCGHSMGGYGALTTVLKCAGRYRSASALAPIVAPTELPWGQKAFTAYLGDRPAEWPAWDPLALIAQASERLPFLVDQGAADEFLERELQPERLHAACAATGHPLDLKLHPGYDHSYFFVASFIGKHIAHHAAALG